VRGTERAENSVGGVTIQVHRVAPRREKKDGSSRGSKGETIAASKKGLSSAPDLKKHTEDYDGELLGVVSLA